MKKFDLKSIDVVALNMKETYNTNGGGGKVGVWYQILGAITDYFKGLSDGYKDFKKKRL